MNYCLKEAQLWCLRSLWRMKECGKNVQILALAVKYNVNFNHEGTKKSQLTIIILCMEPSQY